MDGLDGAEIVLIDSRGCPTDPSIMGAVSQSNGNGKLLQTPFEAFKFPTSDLVQFQALVTPCLPACEPVDCSLPSDPSTGGTFHAPSFGRRRRRALSGGATNHSVESPENVLVMNTIRIADRFKFDDEQRREQELLEENNAEQGRNMATRTSLSSSCLNVLEMVLCGAILIVLQVAVIFAWLLLWRRNQSATKQNKEQQAYAATNSAHYFYAPHHQQSSMIHHPQQQFGPRKIFASDGFPNL